MLNQIGLFGSHQSERKTLRDYQGECVEATFDYFMEHSGSPINVIPVGGGKSLIMAEFIRQANEYYNPTRCIVLSHVSELLVQNSEELINQWPAANISFYSDSLNQKNLHGDIIFAGIQSIYRKAFDIPHAVDLILVDECHLIPTKSDTMYRKFLDDMKIINPHIKVIGYTGTPFRPGEGMLHKGKGALFTHIAYELPIIELIQRGHLVPIVTPDQPLTSKMSVAGVKMSGGDFIASQLAKINNDDALITSCVEELIAHGRERKKWLVFTIDIEHCSKVYEEICRRGITCEMIHSKTQKSKRNSIVDRYKNGDLQCLVNVAVFTTGFNNPPIDLLAFMRPTRSPVLYIQMAGRGMRTSPGKKDCLLLDFGGVVEALGPIDQVRVKEKGEGTGEAPMKMCENCGAYCHAALAKCPDCGEMFPESGLNLEENPSDAAALSTQLKAKVIPVSKVAYYRHKKEGKPDTLRVDYLCGLQTYREWHCFEHTGYPREKACAWWRQRSATTPPNTITEALERSNELLWPKYIMVRKVGTYHEVTGAKFHDDELEEDNG